MGASGPGLGHFLLLLAVVIALVLLAVTIVAIRRLGAASPAPKPNAAPPEPTIAEQIRRAARWVSALYAGRAQADAVPLLIAIGGGSGAVSRLIPALDAGESSRMQSALQRGDCRVAVGRGGAVVRFADGLLDSERREERWDELLRALAREREERPFDGIVVALPAAELAGPARRSDDDLSSLGERVYQLLWKAQRACGWRVPVFLIVTDAEQLEGFTATAAELPEELLREPFGWAVPYALDRAFERAWVDEGIEALVARLSALQITLLTTLQDPNRAEPVLLFPNAVEQMREPLAALLLPMLQASAYHDAFMFRGFYLIGGSNAQADSGARRPDRFAEYLLPERIFSEQYLAQPARGALTHRQRQIRIAQIVLAAAVVLGLAGLEHIRSRGALVQSVLPLMQQVAATAQRAQVVELEAGGASAGGSSSAQATPISAADTEALVTAMGAVSLNRLETPWAPLSYFTDVSGDVEEAIREAYGVVVLRLVHRRLTHSIPRLLGVSPATSAATGGDSETIAASGCTGENAASAGVQRFAKIVNRLGEYSQQLVRYQELTTNSQISDLKPLLEFTLGVSLPPAFTTNYGLYERALRGARAPLLDIASIRGSVDALLSEQFAAALDGAYAASPLSAAVNAIVANAEAAGAPTNFALDRLRSLDTALHGAALAAPQAQYRWLLGAPGNPCLNASLDQIAQLSRASGPFDLAPVDPALPPRLRRKGDAAVSLTRQQLLAAKVYGGTPVLRASGGALGLSLGLLAVDKSLDSFLAQPLAAIAVNSTGALPGPSGAALFWNPQDLQTIQTDAEAYLTFVAQSLPTSLPPGFRLQVESAAGEQLDAMVRNATARAQQSGPANGASALGGTAALSAEMGNFADAAPILTNVQILLREADRLNLATRLNQFLVGQAVRLLRQINAILNASNPYQLVDSSLSFWNGAPPLAAPAFGAATLPDLKATLPARREYVQSLANDQASPIISYLQQPDVLLNKSDRTLVARWQGIVSTLNSYQQGSQVNSLSRLEQFIGADMNQIDLANCAQITGAARGASDWFAAQLANLGRSIRTRCSQISSGQSVASYDALAATFNRDLAGRFPFGPADAPDADFGDVKRFYNQFGSSLTGLAHQLTLINTYQQAGAPDFVQQLIQVQTVLAPMLTNPAPNAPLTYDVNVDFRTNIGSDPGANQILVSVAKFGAQKLSSFSSTNVLAWSNGQDVTIAMRWAKDAPNAPAPGEGARQPRVKGLTASFTTSGAWSLLRMIAAQRPSAAVMAQLSDRQPETVDFLIPLERNPNPVAVGSLGNTSPLTLARVFMRFGLIAVIHVPGQPDKRQPVTLPTFPTAAPEVASSTQSAAAADPVTEAAP